ncbi:HD domain-containing protein [bacterium]|nr:MAG: HD domain-containing protein [bacterium]
MRIMSIENVKPGMTVAKTVFGASCQNLLNAGTVLSEEYITRLKDLEVSSLYILDDNFGDIDIDDIVCDQTRLEAGNFVKDVMEHMKLGKGFDPGQAKRIINSVIEELLSSKELLVKLVDIRSISDYTYFHSVNVAVLSGIIGIGLGYSHLRMQELMIGSLFHDIGKTMLCDQVSCEPSSIEGEPSGDMKKHPLLGFEILKRNKNLSILSAHVAFQHHERYDGTGYPRKLAGPEIHEYAKIVAITNTYDLLTTD